MGKRRNPKRELSALFDYINAQLCLIYSAKDKEELSRYESTLQDALVRLVSYKAELIESGVM